MAAISPSLTTRYLPALTLLVIVLITLAVLWPGLNGGFLFDDYINLKKLGASGSVHDWETMLSFVTTGHSGPTGRPIALLSFLLNDNSWPSPALSFKYTNLMLHLLTGLLLTWASLQLCRFYGLSETRAQYFALFNAAAWLLHPFLISTTFYVVQRMTQLAALFCLAGITAYLHGRRISGTHPRAGYLWMAGGIGLGTLLATFSKENGALLPLLILIIEFCRPKDAAPLRLWFRVIFLYLPSLGIAGYLASQINFSPAPWPSRTFNQPERLLTEARILWDYLGNLLMPRIEGAGLYQDGLVISRDWLHPTSTLPAIVALVGLLAAGLYLHRRVPLLSLAILFFLGGHLLESSLLGLEPYFEHRNYLPAAFLFLPIAQGLANLPGTISVPLRSGVAVVLLGLLGFLSHQRALLWGDAEQLRLYWAVAAPNSPRAQNSLATYYLSHGEPARAEKTLRDAMVRFPRSSLITISDLLTKVKIGTARQDDFVRAGERLMHQPIDGQVLIGLRQMTSAVANRSDSSLLQNAAISMIDRLSQDSTYGRIGLVKRLLPYLKAQIYLAQGRFDRAEDQYRIAINRYNEIDASLQMVAEMATSGQVVPALRLLDAAENLLPGQDERTLRFPRSYYAREIQRLRSTLQGEAAGAKQDAPANTPAG